MYLYFKRVIDLTLSALGLALLSPVLVILGILVKTTSAGPVLFRQTRIGIHKKKFIMLKFRTMRIDTPSETPTHMLSDPFAYITKVGRFLRKSSLDELPQLWNIFIGDMSIVGPRPALWNQDDLIAERDKYKANEVKPGLTGWAQVNGRDELPIPVKAAYDGEYCDKISFVLDCRILLMTVRQMVSGKGVAEGAQETLRKDA